MRCINKKINQTEKKKNSWILFIVLWVFILASLFFFTIEVRAKNEFFYKEKQGKTEQGKIEKGKVERGRAEQRRVEQKRLKQNKFEQDRFKQSRLKGNKLFHSFPEEEGNLNSEKRLEKEKKEKKEEKNGQLTEWTSRKIDFEGKKRLFLQEPKEGENNIGLRKSTRLNRSL